jgi:hypothetical protein
MFKRPPLRSSFLFAHLQCCVRSARTSGTGNSSSGTPPAFSSNRSAGEMPSHVSHRPSRSPQAASVYNAGLEAFPCHGDRRPRAHRDPRLRHEARRQALLIAKFDNLGKGASGAAVQNLNMSRTTPDSKHASSSAPSHDLANTTTALAGITTDADVAKPCIGGPDTSMPPPFPATIGFTQLSYTSLLKTSFQYPPLGNPIS